MKKYENPILSVAKFMTENIITTSGTVSQPKTDAVTAAETWLSDNKVEQSNIFLF